MFLFLLVLAMLLLALELMQALELLA